MLFDLCCLLKGYPSRYSYYDINRYNPYRFGPTSRCSTTLFANRVIPGQSAWDRPYYCGYSRPVYVNPGYDRCSPIAGRVSRFAMGRRFC